MTQVVESGERSTNFRYPFQQATALRVARYSVGNYRPALPCFRTFVIDAG